MTQYSMEHGMRRLNTLLGHASRGVRLAVLAALGASALVAAKPTEAQTIDHTAMQRQIAVLMQQSGGSVAPVTITHTNTTNPIATIAAPREVAHDTAAFSTPSMGQLFADDANDPPVQLHAPTTVHHQPDSNETTQDVVRTVESSADIHLRASFLNGSAPKMWESHGFFVAQEFGDGNVMLGNDIGQRIILSNKQAAKYLLGKKVSEVKIAFADPTTILSMLKGMAETVVLVGTMGQSVLVTASELATGTNAAIKGLSYGLRSAGMGHYLPNVSDMVQQAGQYIDRQLTPQSITAEDIIAATRGVNVSLLNQLPDELVQQLGRARSENQKKRIVSDYLRAHTAVQATVHTADATNTTPTDGSHAVAVNEAHHTHASSDATRAYPIVTPLGGAAVVSDRFGQEQNAAYYGSKVAVGWYDQKGDGVYAGIGGVAIQGVQTTADGRTLSGSDAMLHAGYQVGTRAIGPIDASAQGGVIAEQVTIDGVSKTALKPTLGMRGDVTRLASEAGVGNVVRGGGVNFTMDHSFTGVGNSVSGDIRVGPIALSKGPLVHTIGVNFSENPFDAQHRKAAYTRLLEKIQSADSPHHLSQLITNDILPGTGRRRIPRERLETIKAQAIARADLLQPRTGADSNAVQDAADRDALRRNFETTARNAEKAKLNPYNIDDTEIVRQLAAYAARPTAEGQRVLTAFVQYRIAELSSTIDNAALQHVTDVAAFRETSDVRAEAMQIAQRLDEK